MSRALWLLAAILGTQTTAFCQIPASEKLSASDSKLFHEEIQRIEGLLGTAGDKCTVLYALARTWASGGQYRETMDTLEKVVDLKVGLDPSNDAIFGKLRGTKEFEQLLRRVRDDTPPVLNSRAAFTIMQPDLVPEGMSYDSRRKRFFAGSIYKPKIVVCTPAGACRVLVKEGQDGLSEILGLKVDLTDGTLWAAGNGPTESGLFHYGVPSGKLIRKYTLNRNTDAHVFNDLVINSRGDVYVTDTRAGTVYWVSRTTDRLEVLNPSIKIEGANGIALSKDGKLYVAGFSDGITVVDLASRSFRAIVHPPDLCLATIDGLYFYKDSLIAIQNGVMTHRVVRLYLTGDRNGIAKFEVLERRNPLFEGITTGAIGAAAFYFMANTQFDKVVDGRIAPGVQLNPVQILKIDLY